MEQIISKKEFEEIMKLKGDCRGFGMKTYVNFVLKEEGKEGLEKLENTLNEVGLPMNFKKIKATNFYPMGVWVIFLLAIQRLFNYDNKKIQEMGIFQAKTSLLIKLFMKYFISIDTAVKGLPKIWKQHFTVGDFETIELNKEKRYIILQLKGFPFYTTLQCQSIIGVLLGSVPIILNKKVICEETKCPLRGDEYHEFLLKW